MPTSKATKPAATKQSGDLKATQIGVVETDGRNKTRKVVVNFKAMHPKYGKYVSRRSVMHVHDENNESRAGDTVEIAQCRPVSRTKRWRLVRIVSRPTRVEHVA
ncbi:MAG: 30S ribosomal protein S17 [Phycisphaeraceae bacterium]|nr:30S ribosomal protein S17 [Phycisphaeraceae bacterium]